MFDVSDTGGREFPKSRYLWEYREEHADAVSAMLESRDGVDGKGWLPDQLERIASQLAEEYWRDYKRDILAIVDDSFLYGYDEINEMCIRDSRMGAPPPGDRVRRAGRGRVPRRHLRYGRSAGSGRCACGLDADYNEWNT